MSFCLPKFKADAFRKALKEGEIDPRELSGMTSTERRLVFRDLVGELNAKEVNALFESKLLLKNQKAGFVSWAKQLLSENPAKLEKTLKEVESLEGVLQPGQVDDFLEDLVEKKLGVEVTAKEAGELADLAKNIETMKSLIPEDSPNLSTERLNYGLAKTVFQNYVDELKIKAGDLTFKEYITSTFKGHAASNLKDLILKIGGNTKSLLSSLDNSFFGRQGIKVLFTKPSVWVKGFMKSWGDIATALKGEDPMLAIKSDVFSRKNAINGRYAKSKLAVGITGEEAFPESLPAKIPVLGRLFKASEAAFNGGALRMRADLADVMFDIAEKSGVDLTAKKEIESIGSLVNSLTGRGSVGLTKSQAETVNVLIYSIKFLKANIDTIIQPFNPNLSDFARKQAGMNLVKIIGGMSSVLLLAEAINPDSVDFDPRSANFGKIQVGNTRFDISGGLSSILTLATRVSLGAYNAVSGDDIPEFKSSTSGKLTKLNEGYKGTTPVDLVYDFVEGKAAPVFRAVLDILKQQNFAGEVPTLKSTLLGLVTPLPVQTYEELEKDPNSADILASMILNTIGIGVNTYGGK